jgi:DNA-binding CsgD family transcriptional regulator
MTALRAVPAPEPPVGYVAVRLTDRELRTLELLADGLDTEQIAIKLSYSRTTLVNIVNDLLTKFGAHTRAALIHEAHRHGFLGFVERTDDTALRLAAAEQTITELQVERRYLLAKIERVKEIVR